MRALHQPYSVLRDAGRCWRTSARVDTRARRCPAASRGAYTMLLHATGVKSSTTRRSDGLRAHPCSPILVASCWPEIHRPTIHCTAWSRVLAGRWCSSSPSPFTASYRQTPNSWTQSPTIFMRAVVPCSRCARMATGRLQCAQRVQADAVVFWLIEENEALPWEIARQVRDLREQRIPTLLLTRQPWEVDERARKQLKDFVAGLEVRP